MPEYASPFLEGDDLQRTATAEQIDAAPVGDMFHRAWTCKVTAPERLKYTSNKSRATTGTADAWGRGDVGWERAMVPLPPPPPEPRSAEGTFHWYIRPTGDHVEGDFYLDGSALDGPSAVLMRCGWAFVAVDKAGRPIAAAYGATPAWITDIGGAEA